MKVPGGFIYYGWFDDDPGVSGVFVPYNESEKMTKEKIAISPTIDEKIATFYADKVFDREYRYVSESGKREIWALIGLVKEHYEGKK